MTNKQPENTISTHIQIIKANYALQQRIGSGPLSPKLIEKCEKAMERKMIDFVPLGMILLKKLKKIIEKYRATPPTAKKNQFMLGELRVIVMEIKANSGAFKYNLVSDLANIMLSLLESINALDDDVIEIIEAHHQTLKAITDERESGDCGEKGRLLQQELINACQRYYKSRLNRP
jgi:hypothetical protein